MGYSEYKFSISLDSKKTIRDIKVAIGRKLELDISEFIIKRGNRNSLEIKDLS